MLFNIRLIFCHCCVNLYRVNGKVQGLNLSSFFIDESIYFFYFLFFLCLHFKTERICSFRLVSFHVENQEWYATSSYGRIVVGVRGY